MNERLRAKRDGTRQGARGAELTRLEYLSASPIPDLIRSGGLQSTFGELYLLGRWGDGTHPGSSLESTREYRACIEEFLVEHSIRSVLDVGCGEFGFSAAVDWKGARYVGLDIVESVIACNRERFPHHAFVHADALHLDAHTGFDLLLVKDLLQHWSLENVRSFLAQPALQSFRHILITHCDDERADVTDIQDGDFRPLNILSPALPSIGARPLRRIGTKRVVHRGPRITAHNVVQRFEWWVVNLERRPDRLAHARAQLERLGVSRVHRFQAFDGQRLKLTSQRPDWVRRGPIGCYLSHVAILKQAQARRQPCVIVEDDLVLVDDFLAELDVFLAEVPDDWDAILCSAGEHCQPPKQLGPHLTRLTATWGTTLCIFRLATIDRLLEEADSLDRPIDDFYIRMMDELKFYSPVRQIVTQKWGLGTDMPDQR